MDMTYTHQNLGLSGFVALGRDGHDIYTPKPEFGGLVTFGRDECDICTPKSEFEWSVTLGRDGLDIYTPKPGSGGFVTFGRDECDISLDDLFSGNNEHFKDYVSEIYPPELEIKQEHSTPIGAS